METDEGVRVQTMPTGTVPAVDHDHPDVRVVDQCVRERHPGRPSADYEVVGLQPLHHVLMLPRRTSRSTASTPR